MRRFETFRLEVDAGLAHLTLDRPDRRDGMTNEMVRETHDAVAGDMALPWLLPRLVGCTTP